MQNSECGWMMAAMAKPSGQAAQGLCEQTWPSGEVSGAETYQTFQSQWQLDITLNFLTLQRSHPCL